MTPWVRRLLIANVVVFVATMALPGLLPLLALVPRDAWRMPWTPITYMFVHGGLTHILFNMLVLFFFGPRLEMRLGSDRFVRLYLASGLMGGVVSLVFRPATPIIGASAAIFGVMLGFARYWPREKIYIWGVLPIEARWLVILTTAFAMASVRFGFQAGVAHFAHLGGYLGGWLYLVYVDRQLERTRREWRQKVEAVPSTVKPRVLEKLPVIDLAKVHPINREEIERLVAKARAEGLESLSPSERIFLSNFVSAEG